MIHNKIVDLRNSGEKRSVILPRDICKKKINCSELKIVMSAKEFSPGWVDTSGEFLGHA